MDFTEIIKIVGGIISGITLMYAKYKFDARQAKQAIEVKPHATKGEYDLLQISNQVELDFALLLKTTNADRILGLTSFGDVDYFTINTWYAVNSFKSDVDQLKEYSGIRSDEVYRKLLQRVETEQRIVLETPNLEGIIRNFYDMEGVTFSVWGRMVFINTHNKKEMVYMSVSTHTTFAENDLTKIKNTFSRGQEKFKILK